jgi:acyl-CoA synthetase (AMP-forming)/AMP-acid ligase II
VTTGPARHKEDVMNVLTLMRYATDATLLHQINGQAASGMRSKRAVLENVGKLCAGLAELGIKTGARVVFMTGPRLEALELILACINSGAISVPVDPCMGIAALKKIVLQLRPKYCVIEDPPGPELELLLAEHQVAVIAIKFTNSRNICATYNTLISNACATLQLRDFPHDQTALIVHTSGSEGVPKAVQFNHGNLFNFFHFHELTYRQYFDDDGALHRKKPFLTVFPFHHLAGLGICMQALISNRPVFIFRHFIPRLYLRVMETTQCSVIMLVPSMYRLLLKERELIRQLDLAALRYCISLGEPTPDSLAERIENEIGGRAVSAYGLTECYLGVIHARDDLLHGRVRRGSFGKLFFGEVKLVDACGNENDSTGELWIRNSSVRECYLDAGANAGKLHNGWFRTGDLVYRDPDGNYFHRGRCDDMFVCNGRNIYPMDIERVLSRHPSIDMVCAAAIENHNGERIPAALVKLKNPATESEIVNYYLARGAIHSVPKLIKITGSLPVTGTGKVNRIETARILQNLYRESRNSVINNVWQS